MSVDIRAVKNKNKYHWAQISTSQKRKFLVSSYTIMSNRTALSSVHTLLHSSTKLYFLNTQRKKNKGSKKFSSSYRKTSPATNPTTTALIPGICAGMGRKQQKYSKLRHNHKSWHADTGGETFSLKPYTGKTQHCWLFVTQI